MYKPGYYYYLKFLTNRRPSHFSHRLLTDEGHVLEFSRYKVSFEDYTFIQPDFKCVYEEIIYDFCWDTDLSRIRRYPRFRISSDWKTNEYLPVRFVRLVLNNIGSDLFVRNGLLYILWHGERLPMRIEYDTWYHARVLAFPHNLYGVTAAMEELDPGTWNVIRRQAWSD